MKKLVNVLFVALIAMSCLFAQGSNESAAEAKIDENITIYVTVKVGGALDVRARVLAEYLSEDLGVDVIVQNVPGAGGLTCATQMFTNPNGPFDMMFTATSTFTAGPVFEESVIYSIDDFRVLAPVDVEEFGLFVRPDKYGFHTFDDVIAYADDNEIIFGCGGIANITYIYQAALYEYLGFNYNTLIHNGAIEGITNNMGGHNMITMSGLETARPYVENGDIVPVLTFRDTDFTGYEGYTVPTILKYRPDRQNVYSSLMEIVCLAELDDVHAMLLEESVARVLADPECVADLKKVGLNYIPDMTPAEATQYIKDEYKILEDFVAQLM